MFIHSVDKNNMKALAVVKSLLAVAESGDMEGIDHLSLLEIICDYLQSNDRILNENV